MISIAPGITSPALFFESVEEYVSVAFDVKCHLDGEAGLRPPPSSEQARSLLGCVRSSSVAQQSGAGVEYGWRLRHHVEHVEFLLSRLITPPTSNTTMRGPLMATAAAKEPGPSVFRFVTPMIAPPRPPGVVAAQPVAPGKARGCDSVAIGRGGRLGQPLWGRSCRYRHQKCGNSCRHRYRLPPGSQPRAATISASVKGRIEPRFY